MFTALTSLLGSYLQARALGKLGAELGDYADRWFRLMASVLVTTYITFPGIWGMTTLGLWQSCGIWVALGVGFATALFTTPLVVYNMWTRSELTKNIPIGVPSQLAQAALNQNVNIVERR
jgi:hypothetical protein